MQKSILSGCPAIPKWVFFGRRIDIICRLQSYSEKVITTKDFGRFLTSFVEL